MAEDTRPEAYAELASVGPYGVRPGHALITMVEPHPGHEYAYNRWYEDDHYYAGAMAMPWMYAGRRWVATRELQELRYPEKSAIAQPVGAGLLPLHVLDHRGPLRRAHEVDRRHQQAPQPRRPGLPGPHPRLHRLPGPRGDRLPGRRGGPPRLPRPGPSRTPGWSWRSIDAESAEQRAELLEWLRSRHLPRRLAGGPAAMVTVFRPTPLPGDRMTYVKQVEGVDTRLTLLWFLERDPREVWADHFTGLDTEVGRNRPGEGGVGGAVHPDRAGHRPLRGRTALSGRGRGHGRAPSAGTADQSRGLLSVLLVHRDRACRCVVS